MKFTMVLAVVAALFSAGYAEATTARDQYIDNIGNLSGGSLLAVPSVGSSFVSDSATQTLTNKTISGASNTLSNIPASAISSGQLGVANGGTGASTLAAHGVVLGNGTSPVAVTATGSSGQVLTSNGAIADPTWQAVPSTAPTINGTSASPLSVTASVGIALSTPAYANVAFIAASTSGTTVVTATPSITACTAAGQALKIVSESSTNLVTLQNNGDLAGSKVLLNGPWTSGMNNGTPYTLDLVCDGAVSPAWVEVARNN